MLPARLSTLQLSLVALLAGVAPAGCYKPNIKEGGLKCNPDAGVGKSCPEGFKCDIATNLCWRTLPKDASDAPDRDAQTPDLPAEKPPVCFDARPDCTPLPGTCDPFCQTGCGCREKCSVNTLGDRTCNPPSVTGFPKQLLQDCTPIESTDTPQQTDNCAPGMVCIDEGCFPRCFQFCHGNTDCMNSSCTRDVGGVDSGQKVCDVPFADACVPLLGNMNTGCGGVNSAMACYISSTSPTHTICDCPFKAVGSNGACTRSRDCIKGLACVDMGTGAMPTCLQVCRLADEGQTDCPSRIKGSCHRYYGIPPGTEFHATYGFCL